MKPRGKLKLAKGAMDLAPVREMVRDSVPATLVHGKVVADQDGEPYRFSAAKDVFLDVMTTAGQRLPCRLCGTAGGPGSGVWMIPPVGTEVEVLQEDGRSPRIIGVASSAELPALLVTYLDVSLIINRKRGDIRIHATQIPSMIDGPATNGNVYVTAEGKVYLGASAGTVALALAPNTEARLQALESHRHAGVTTGSGISGGALLASATLAQVEPATAIANPASPDPGHLHDPDNAPGEHTLCPAFKATVPGAGSAVAATKVMGI